jgi:hypothetical protein
MADPRPLQDMVAKKHRFFLERSERDIVLVAPKRHKNFKQNCWRGRNCSKMPVRRSQTRWT